MVDMKNVQRKILYFQRATRARHNGVLTRREWQVLTMLLEHTDKDFRVVDSIRYIANLAEWDQANTMRCIRNLEAKGWIFRKLGRLALTRPLV